MTGSARDDEDCLPPLRVAWRRSAVRGEFAIAGHLRASPGVDQSLHQRVDLRVGQIATGGSRKGRLRGAWHTSGDHLPQPLVGNERQVDRVVERPRGPELTVHSVAARAVASVERVESDDL